MKYLSSLRKRISSRAFRAAVALIDRSLALAAIAAHHPAIKVVLNCLQVLTKFLLCLTALQDAKEENAERTEGEDEPP